MPVTAKLSRRFYEQFGDELANELVDWFNTVDFTYRSDLDRLNELNFARFDAKLEQRLTSQDAKWDRRFTELEAKWDLRFTEVEGKWDRRFAEFEVKWDRRFAEFEVKWEQRFAQLEVNLERRFARLEKAQVELRTDMVKWMFAFWTGTMIALAGFLFAILRSRPGG